MNITIVGTGYVGLVSGLCLADKGHRVTCVDVDEDKISRLSQGESPIHEEGLQALLNRLLNELYDLQSEAGAGDYTTAAETLMTKQRKRSLVVMLTNLRQADSDLLPAVQLIRSRHAVLVASLRERSVDEALKQEVATFDDALTVLGANRYQEQRRRLMARLATSAQLVRDCTPDELPAELVNGYWSLKRAGVL